MNFLKKYAHLLVGTTLVFLGSPHTAQAASLVGGQLFATGGEVSLQILSPMTSAYTTTLFLLDPQTNVRQNLATNWNVGRVINLGEFEAGQELIFGIFVHNTGNTFLMGPGSRNSDGIAHAAVNFIAPDIADVGFEDLKRGGDRDYNDNRFRFSGGISASAVPEPTTIAGLAIATSGLLAARRRQKSVAAKNG